MKQLSKTAVALLTAALLAVAPDHANPINATPLAIHDSTAGRVVPAGSVVNMRPAPELTPGQVVVIILEALATNDKPHANAGAEVAYRFSSPDNQLTTGPLEKFVDLVHNPVYSPVLNHQHARFGDIVVADGKATVPVVIVSETAERHGFLFTLTHQEGGALDGCWLTESVIPFEVQDETEDEPIALMNT